MILKYSPELQSRASNGDPVAKDLINLYRSLNQGRLDRDNLASKAIRTPHILNDAVTPEKRSGGFKVGSFSFAGSGTEVKAVTGVGFTPKSIVFFLYPGDITTSAQFAVGFTDGVSQLATCTNAYHGATPNMSTQSESDACILTIGITNAIITEAAFTSFDADGFTVTASTSTAAQTFMYIAFA